MSELRPSEKRGEPTVALFLTWFLPGAGHVYLGRFGFAAVAFLVVEGIYALGYLFSGGRAFEFLDPELRGFFATFLSPEMGNFGAMLFQHKTVGFGTGEPLPYPPYVELGSILTSLSGVVNIFFMVHAHLTARTPDSAPRRGKNPVVLLAATWALPGLGHFLQGRKLRGAIVCGLLLSLFIAGTVMADGSNLSRIRHFYYWSGQFFLGLPAILTELLSGRPPVQSDIQLVDAGLLYACMSGLLNILAMLDVFGVAEKRWLEGDSETASSSPEPERARPGVEVTSPERAHPGVGVTSSNGG